MNKQPNNDRRRHPRYFTNEGVFVNAARSFGRIVDISLGGMKFHYLNWDKSTEMEGELDIYLNGEDILSKLPFKVVPGRQEEESRPDNKVILKPCRVQFKNLNNAQKKKLEHFILEQTSGATEH
jgi:c-di-GMP-binding flagellar brake protein YcgR